MKTKKLFQTLGISLLVLIVAFFSWLVLQFYTDVRNAEFVDTTIFITQSVSAGEDSSVCILDDVSDATVKKYEQRIKKFANFSPQKLLIVQQRLIQLQQKYPEGFSSRCFFELLIQHIQDILDNQNNTPVCGNAIVEDDEACDDGNTNNGDGCSSVCLLEVPELDVSVSGVYVPMISADDVIYNSIQYIIQATHSGGNTINPVITYSIPEGTCFWFIDVGFADIEFSNDNRTTWYRGPSGGVDCTITDVRAILHAAYNTTHQRGTQLGVIIDVETEGEVCNTILFSADNAQYIKDTVCVDIPVGDPGDLDVSNE